jgi:hypothetical protein
MSSTKQDFKWKVVPISKYQQLDVNHLVLLDGGAFRKCNTYKGGGGYDQFPAICERRLGKRLHQQFIVQLYGCNLRLKGVRTCANSDY